MSAEMDAQEAVKAVAEQASWYESEGIRMAIAAITGGAGVRVVDNIFRWRSEGAAVRATEIDIDARASGEWQKLYNEQSQRLARAEASCSEKIAALEARVRDLENELYNRQNPFPRA